MLFDVLDRVRDLAIFYTDTGVLPRQTVLQSFTTSTKFSFHMMSGGIFIESLLFLIHFIAVLYFTVGRKTWFANLVCWLFFISVQCRNFVIHQASDTLLCQLLFLGLLLPLGRGHLDDEEETVLSPGTAAYLVFFVSILIISGLFKVASPLWQQGDGIFHAFSSDFHGGRLGVYLLGYPRLLRLINYATIVVEIALPLLLLFVSGKLRYAILAAMAGFFFSLFLFLRVGEFPALLIVGLFPLLPTTLWRKVRLPVRALGESAPASDLRFVPALGAAVVALLVAYEINTVYPMATLPPRIIEVGNAFHLLETWSMFSSPANNDGYYEFEGLTSKGRTVNLLDGSDDHERPEFPSEIYKNQRWLKLFQSLPYRRNLVPAVGQLFCERRDFLRDDERLLKVKLSFHRKLIRPGVESEYLPPERFYYSTCGRKLRY